MEIRLADLSHLEAIHEIYIDIVENTHISFEYTPPKFSEFKERFISTIQNYPWLVALDDGLVIGYAYGSRLRARKAYDWIAESSVYVNPTMHQKGVGSLLYAHLIEIFKMQNIQRVFGAIALPNDKSVKFHEKQGFNLTGVFPNAGFKMNEWHDVAWYVKLLSQKTPPDEFIPFSILIKNDKLR